MTQVYLQDFDTYDSYLLDTDGDLRPPLRLRRPKIDAKCQGFYSVRKLSLFPPRVKDLIAVFSDGQFLRMIIKGQQYNLSESAITTKRKRLFLGVRAFFLMNGEQVLVSCVYWNTCGTSPEGSDIFEYIERVTKDGESKAHFLRLWNERLIRV